MRRAWLIGALLAGTIPATAEAQEIVAGARPPGLRGTFGAAFQLGLPRGAFQDRVGDTAALGLGLELLGGPRWLPVQFGPTVAFFSYPLAEYTREAAVEWQGGQGRDTVPIARSQHIVELGVRGRAMPRFGRVRPFVDTALAFALFKPEEELAPTWKDAGGSGDLKLADCQRCRLRPGWSAELGAGVAVMTFGDHDNGLLDVLVGVKWRHGSTATYDRPGSPSTSARSRTDMLLFTLGVAVGGR